MISDAPSCWINTVSLEHVRAGVHGGFTQARHGKRAGLLRLSMGDVIAFYSPRTAYPGGDQVQAFTAIGVVTDLDPYQTTMSDDFHPWRRNIEFVDSDTAPIRPLLPVLEFLPDKARWGMIFRRGLFSIPHGDMMRIATAMSASRLVPGLPDSITPAGMSAAD